MTKKTFTAAKRPQSLTADQAAFVANGRGKDRTAPAEPTKRISVDIPQSLHKRFKLACATTDTQMTNELMRFIEQRTAELEKSA